MLCVHCPCNEIWIQQRRGFRLARHQHRGHRGEVAVFLFFFYFSLFGSCSFSFFFFFYFSLFDRCNVLGGRGPFFSCLWEGREGRKLQTGANIFLNLMFRFDHCFKLFNDQGNPQPCLDERGASVPIQAGEVGDGGHLGHRQELGLARPPPGHLEPP